MHYLKKFDSFGFLFLRIAIGAIFIVHGVQKFGVWSNPPAKMAIIMKILSIVEPLGGIAMILGIFVPLASIGLGIIMLGAIYTKIVVFKTGFSGGWEFDFIILAGCVSLFFTGSGKLSIDHFVYKKKEQLKTTV